ncbi:hypothetical protein RSAG8_10043, partial [Rhizoctonia solani AG-8 WAC10335]
MEKSTGFDGRPGPSSTTLTVTIACTHYLHSYDSILSRSFSHGQSDTCKDPHINVYSLGSEPRWASTIWRVQPRFSARGGCVQRPACFFDPREA